MGTAAWRMRACDAACVAALEAAGTPPLLARLLASRGVTADGREAFFDPSLARLARPEALPGVAEAVRVVLPFLRARRPIVVFGDYDADGVCAAAILVTALRRLGGVAEAFIPRRFGEGYGMTPASLERLLAEHPGVALVVTVDNGISSPREVAALRARGVAVVVTDHHLPGDARPEADALVNPRVAAAPGCEDLCGAGVAFFLASALAQAATDEGLYAGPKFGGGLLVLAGLATVADLMPLTRQNRILVAQALALFGRCAPLGLHALYEKAARNAKALTARDFGFLLAPRINAAGRMETARTAYDLLMCTADEERERARRLAVAVEGFNGRRRGKEKEMFDAACRQIGPAAGQAAVVACSDAPDGHLGVAGIVAARLLEVYHVPAAVVVGETGSVRAPDGYNVHDALAAASAHLVRFGGHAAAGGFTVRPGALKAFAAAFTEACAAQRAAAPAAAGRLFDGWVAPGDLTPGLCAELRRLEPFGEGNPEPVFGLRGVLLREAKAMGADGRHLALSFASCDAPRAVWWGHGEAAARLRAEAARPHDVFFTLATSEFGTGTPHLELRVEDVRATRPSAATTH